MIRNSIYSPITQLNFENKESRKDSLDIFKEQFNQNEHSHKINNKNFTNYTKLNHNVNNGEHITPNLPILPSNSGFKKNLYNFYTGESETPKSIFEPKLQGKPGNNIFAQNEVKINKTEEIKEIIAPKKISYDSFGTPVPKVFHQQQRNYGFGAGMRSIFEVPLKKVSSIENGKESNKKVSIIIFA